MKKYGQYFTTNELLKEKIISLSRKKHPKRILEPSFGKGHLIQYFLEKKDIKNFIFDCYEIDKTLIPLPQLNKYKINIIYCNFLTKSIKYKYDIIIGNPPYIQTNRKNIYLLFIWKCLKLLRKNGELIFIVPSSFMKSTSSIKVID